MKKTFDPAMLSNFTGSATFYRHGIVRSVFFTEGARYVAESAEAFWLLDEIAIAQYKPVVKREEFQVWKLEVKGGAGELSCEDGNDNIVFYKVINFTDFPAPGVTLWFENSTIYLPSER
jgi:hypothetical protein